MTIRLGHIGMTFGWWLVPLLLTGGSLIWVLGAPYSEEYDYGDQKFMRMIIALVVSLVAWLIYFIIF